MDNTNKNPIFSIKNFRSFGEDGADFELAPITVLTGCNSAGKSSLVKALILLSRQEIKRYEDGTLHSAALKTSSSDLKLGGFNKIIHFHDTNRKLIFVFSLWSKLLNRPLVCKCEYLQKNGVINDGILSEITIEKDNGSLIFQAKLVRQLEGDMSTGAGQEFEFLEINDNLIDSINEDFRRFIIVYNYKHSKNLFLNIGKIYSNHKDFDSFINSYKDSIMDNLAKRSGLKIEALESYGFNEESVYQHIIDALNNYNNKIELLKTNGITMEQAEEYDDDAINNWKMIIEDYNTRMQEWKDVIEETQTEDERDNILKKLFYDNLVNEIIKPFFLNDLIFVDSSTNKINRTYNVDDKDKLSIILCQLLNRFNANEYRSSEFINKWLQRFRIADCIVIVGTEENSGVRVYLEKGGNRLLLADEGYGITQLTSLLLQVDIAKNKNRYINGMGVIFFRSSFICVEEPEIHLHPRYQSLLAEMFVEAYQKYNIHFIIETHSEYLIRKLQVMVADKENTLTSNDVALNYVEKNEEGISHNRQIKILEDGRLSEPFGSGFYDEADTLAMELMKYKARKK